MGLASERSYEKRPNFSLHMEFDGTHPNLFGTFLGAYVTFFTLYGDTVGTLDYDYFGRVSAEVSHTCNGLRGKRLLIFALGICDSILLA